MPSKPTDVHSTAVNSEDHPKVNTIVHVSWNGATEVKSWRLFKSTADGKTKEFVASTPRQGFETAISFAGYAAFVGVEALDEDGEILMHGRSEIIKTIEPENMESPDVAKETQWLQNPHSKSAPGAGSDSSKDDSAASGDTWQSLLDVLSKPIVVFGFGFVCCALVGFCLLGRFTRWSRSSWQVKSPLYKRFFGQPTVYIPATERYQESVEQFELDSDDEHDTGAGTDETSKPLMRRKKYDD
jgi:hypothetical protein